MQIAIRIVAACVTATLFSPVLLVAEDTSAQIKARQALDQRMHGSQPGAAPSSTAPAAQEAQPATPPPAATTPTTSTTPPPAQPAAVAPTQTLAPAADTPVLVGPEPSSEESIEKARQALRQKMDELSGKPPASPAAMTATAPAAVATTGYEAEKQKAVNEAHAAAAKQAAEQQSQPAAATSAMHASKKGSYTLEPLKGPPSPLTPDKQNRLKTLLDQYMADQLTPEQYHAERAKVLAGP